MYFFSLYMDVLFGMFNSVGDSHVGGWSVILVIRTFQ